MPLSILWGSQQPRPGLSRESDPSAFSEMHIRSCHSPASKSMPPGAPQAREENADVIEPLPNLPVSFFSTLPIGDSVLTPGHVCSHPRALARAVLSAENVLPETLKTGSLLPPLHQVSAHVTPSEKPSLTNPAPTQSCPSPSLSFFMALITLCSHRILLFTG